MNSHALAPIFSSRILPSSVSNTVRGNASNSGQSTGNGVRGSNYISNIVLGSQRSPDDLGGSFAHAPSAFAQEALKTANSHASLMGKGPQSLHPDPSPAGVPNKSFLHSNWFDSTTSGLANQITSIASAGVGGAMAAADSARASKDYAHNVQQHGIGVEHTARNIAATAQSHIASGQAGATIGSLFGPLGALAGYMIGSHIPSKVDDYKVASMEGSIKADDTGLSASHNAEGLSGVTMTESNV